MTDTFIVSMYITIHYDCENDKHEWNENVERFEKMRYCMIRIRGVQQDTNAHANEQVTTAKGWKQGEGACKVMT